MEITNLTVFHFIIYPTSNTKSLKYFTLPLHLNHIHFKTPLQDALSLLKV